MRITPRPLTASDDFDQSRDIAGMNKWRQSSRTIGFIMFILGWFTIPVEVFLRRDFGQRWFTALNFYAGLFLLLIFAMVQYVLAALWGGMQDFFSRLASAINPFHTQEEPTFTDGIMDKSMMLLLITYILIGSYHLFKIWWRNKANTALHSFDDGTSRFEPLAGYLMRLLNWLAVPFVAIYRRLLPKAQRTMAAPKLISDRTAFTNTVFEPLVLLLLSFWFQGITSVWLFISTIALTIHANWKETAKMNKILDFRDSMVEAKTMRQFRENAESAATTSNAAQPTQHNNPTATPQHGPQYPDLRNIIEQMYVDGSHLA